MARYTGPVCRLCRRDGLKLFLKGTRCDTPKCAIERRDSPAGHAPVAPRQAHRLRRRTCARSRRSSTTTACSSGSSAATSTAPRSSKGNTGDDADGACWNAGSTTSCIGSASARAAPGAATGRPRPHHRQRPPRRHPQLPGSHRRRDPREESGQEPATWSSANLAEIGRDVPDFLTRSDGSRIPEGIVSRLPAADDVSIPVQTQLIVELCSR